MSAQYNELILINGSLKNRQNLRKLEEIREILKIIGDRKQAISQSMKNLEKIKDAKKLNKITPPCKAIENCIFARLKNQLLKIS